MLFKTINLHLTLPSSFILCNFHIAWDSFYGFTLFSPPPPFLSVAVSMKSHFLGSPRGPPDSLSHMCPPPLSTRCLVSASHWRESLAPYPSPLGNTSKKRRVVNALCIDFNPWQQETGSADKLHTLLSTKTVLSYTGSTGPLQSYSMTNLCFSWRSVMYHLLPCLVSPAPSLLLPCFCTSLSNEALAVSPQMLCFLGNLG